MACVGSEQQQSPTAERRGVNVRACVSPTPPQQEGKEGKKGQPPPPP